MKILIDKNIPYVEHFFQEHLNDIEYFTDHDFDISEVAEDSIVITRSTYRTHGKRISNAVKFLCSASTGEDHFDKNVLENMKIPYAFSSGANAVAVREYVFSVIALMLEEKKINQTSPLLIIGCGIIVNTSRGGVVSEKDFLELDDDRHCIRLISDVFENEPNINEDFLNKNLFATPHIAGHSQFARYQMTKMAYENVMNFLGQDISKRNSILENRIINFEKNIFDKDMKEFGLPVTLMLETYNPKSDVFNYKDFKKVRDNYNNRIGYSQVIIKGCSDEPDRENLKSLGFTVEEN